MFCSKCGAKAIGGAAFCEKCGARLIVSDAGSTTAERSVQTDMRGPAEPMASEASKVVEEVAPEISKPDKPTVSEAQKSADSAGQAAAETPNTFEPVSAGDIYDLLRKDAPNCPKIKKVDFQQKTGITMLKGKKNRYFVGFSRGDYRLSVCPKFLLSLHRIIFWFVILVTVSLLVEGVDLEEIYPLLGWCLLIGGVGGVVSGVICRGEKKEVVTFITEALSKAVCVKGPVAPIIEPLMSHPRLWFLGFSLPMASVIEPIVYSLAALAGVVVLTVGSGVLDNISAPGYNESGYGAYNDKPETDQYMSSPDVENILLSNEYTNEEEGFSFMYPYDWDIEDVEEANPDALVSVACTGMLGTYARIAVMKEADDGSYFAATRSDFEMAYSSEAGLSDVAVMDLSDMVLDGCPARKLTVAFNNDVGVRLISIQYFYIRDSYVYCVTCVVEEANYDSYEPRFNAIMDSFAITAANEAALSFDPFEIVNMYEGSWSGRDYDRLYMEISYMDENGGYFDISIGWSGGASELIEWYLEGNYADGGIYYRGQQLEWYVDDPNGGAGTRVVSEAEEGFLWIGDDGVLYWDDYADSTEECYALEKNAY